MPIVESKTWGTVSVKHLVYESPGEFIVFIDDENDLDWKVDNAYADANQVQYRESRGLINAAANTEAMPCANLSPEDSLKFKRLVGEALTSALLFDLPRAEQMIANAREFNLTRNREVSRCWQLVTCGVVTAAAIAGGLLAWSHSVWIERHMGSVFLTLLVAGVAGIAGSFFSIASRMANLGMESGSSGYLHIAESVTRMFTGGISGVFGVVAVKSGIILTNLLNGSDTAWNVLLIGLAAGLSERFVPSMIAKVGLPENPAQQAQNGAGGNGAGNGAGGGAGAGTGAGDNSVPKPDTDKTGADPAQPTG